MSDNEQWKLDGNCSICRKEKYCGTSCKAHIDRLAQEIRAAFGRTRAGRLMDAANMAMMGINKEADPAYKENE